MVIIFGRWGVVLELILPKLIRRHYIIFFIARLIFHPSLSPDNYCTVQAIISFGYSSTGAEAANFCSVFVCRAS